MLRDAVRDSGLTQRQVALLTGLTQQALNRVLNGQNGITVHHAVLLEEALGISADGILVTQMQEQLRDVREARRGFEPEPDEDPKHRCNRMDDVFRRCLKNHNHDGRHIYA